MSIKKLSRATQNSTLQMLIVMEFCDILKIQ